jgi:hypothetical protein
MQLELLSPCQIPACPSSVAQDGDVCDRCRIAFDWMLQEIRIPEPEAPGQDPSEPGTGADLRGTNGPDRRVGQCCWICESRRSCTRIRGRWECRICAKIDGSDDHDVGS